MQLSGSLEPVLAELLGVDIWQVAQCGKSLNSIFHRQSHTPLWQPLYVPVNTACYLLPDYNCTPTKVGVCTHSHMCYICHSYATVALETEN